MKPYEYDANGRVLCVSHHLLRCSECEYKYDLEQQNKRYRESIKKSIKDLEEDINIVDCAKNAHYTLSKALEGEKFKKEWRLYE